MSYTVTDFHESVLHHLFTDCNVGAFNRKRQIDYLAAYLVHKNVQTILIENDYIDRFYLEDYSEYYVRCFTQYPKSCKRFHFFKTAFTEAEFSEFLLHTQPPLSNAILQRDYVGFVVIKPLPETIIGRTCLEAYEEDAGSYKRVYNTSTDYDVGVFGIKLIVHKTLPFQEQDKVISACSTSALWSLFHAASSIKSYQIKSPVQITKIATSNSLYLKNSFPVQGLTVEMMGHALASEGLEPFHVDLSPVFNNDQEDSFVTLKEYTYAYHKDRIPMILGIDVYSRENGKTKHKSKRNKHKNAIVYKHLGKHAVTISGFSVKNKCDATTLGLGGFYTNAMSINKIYVHDDQVGPFARIEFMNDNTVKYAEASTESKDSFYCGRVNHYMGYQNNGIELDYIFLPNNLLAGLYHKIRIPYTVIREAVKHFNDLLVAIVVQAPEAKQFLWPATTVAYLWDIHLVSATNIKNEIRQNTSLDAITKERFLTRNTPKYIWRAKALYEDVPMLDLLFDATDIPQGKIFMQVLEYCEDIKVFINSMFGNNGKELPSNFKKDKSLLLYKIIKELGCAKFDPQEELTEKYGKARYPLLLKGHEVDGLDVVGSTCVTRFDGSNADFVLDISIEKYLWAIDAEGLLLIAPEIEKREGKLLGHPNLLKGEKARICGEISYDDIDMKWSINNASGRYSRHSAGHAKSRLENAQLLFNAYLVRHSDQFTIKLSQFHDQYTLNTVDEFHVKLMEVPDDFLLSHYEFIDELAAKALISIYSEIEESICQKLDDAGNELRYLMFLSSYWGKCSKHVSVNLLNKIIQIYNTAVNEIKTAVVSTVISALDKSIIPDERKGSAIVLLKLFKNDFNNAPMTETYIKAHNYLQIATSL